MFTKTLIKIQVLCLALIANLPFANAQTSCIVHMSPNVAITCNDVTPRTFFANCGAPAGSNIQYRWKVGPGWNGASGNSLAGAIITTHNSSLTLVPASNISPANYVSVEMITPTGIILGYGSTTAVVSTGLSNSMISGNPLLCTGSQVYSINILSNETVSWAVSDPSKATITGSGTNSVTVTKLANGQFDLTATVTNACGLSATRTLTINRPTSLVTTARVIGGSSICSGSAIYTMTALQSGETVTSWGVSNPSKASINPLGNNVVVTKLGDGEVILTGRVVDQCGRIAAKTIKIGLGIPVVTNPNCGPATIIPIGQLPNSFDCELCRSSNIYTTENMIEAAATGGNNLNWEWDKITNNFGWSTTQNIARFQPYYNGTIQFRVRAQNTCGWSAWKDQTVTVAGVCPNDDDFDQGPFISGAGFRTASPTNQAAAAKTLDAVPSVDYFSVYPNPASTVINLELADWGHTPQEAATIMVEMYDVYGSLKLSQRINDNSAQIDVSEFAKGAYLLRVNVDGEVETHKIIVQ